MDNFDPNAYAAKYTPKAFDPNEYAKNFAPSNISKIKSAVNDSEEAFNQSPIGQIKKNIIEPTASWVGEKANKYISQPARSGAYALQRGENPLSAAADSFGRDKSSIPDAEKSYAGLYQNAGASPYVAKALGGYSDVFGDPVMVAGPALKGAGALAKASGASEAASSLADAIKQRETYKQASNAVSGLADAAGTSAKNTVAKAGSLIGGQTPEEIKTYAENLKEINSKIAQPKSNVIRNVDDLRGTISDDINQTRMGHNAELESAINANGEKPINMQPTMESLDGAIRKVNPNTHPDDFQHLMEMKENLLKNNSSTDLTLGSGAPQDAARTPTRKALDSLQMLQDNSVYQKNGKLTSGGELSQKLLKNVAGTARSGLAAGAPELTPSLEKMARLHDVESTISPALIKEGGSESSILTAGGSTPNRFGNALEDLGSLTGKNYVGEAQKLAAQKAFTNTPLIGGRAGLPGAAKYIPSSPALVKGAINTGAVSADLLGKIKDAALSAGKAGASSFSKINPAISLGRTSQDPESLAEAFARRRSK